MLPPGPARHRSRLVAVVDGKALRVRSTLKLEDAGGREPYKIQERKVRVQAYARTITRVNPTESLDVRRLAM